MSEFPWLAHYDPGVPHSLAPYPARTLLDYVNDTVRERPEHAAFLFKGRPFSVADLQRTSDAFAAALATLGVKRGDRVAALLPNCPQFFIAELGAWKLGAIFAPLNPIYTEEELTGPLGTIDAQVVVTLTSFYERLKKVQAQTPVKRIVTTNIKEYFPALVRLAFTLFVERKGGHRITRRDGDPALADLLAQFDGQRSSGKPPAPGDTAILLMSGGTTGAPKCVMGEHQALVMSGLQIRAWLGPAIEPWTSVYMMPLPMFHSYGACAVQSSTFIGHNPIALVPNPRDLNDVVKTIASVKPTVFAGVPTLYNALLNHPHVKSHKVSFRSLKVCASGAAPLMAETKRRFEEVSGARILEGYGLTESLIAACVNPLSGPSKEGSIGMPLPDVVVKVVDAEDPTKEMPTKEVGEMLLRAPQIMKGYWKNPEGTAEMVWTDAAGIRWLRSGDLAYFDDDGYLFIVDRKKDLIKANGMQVWPRELEEAIATHPAVAEVGVRGFPDPAHGEIAVAFVVLRAGMTATEADIREYCKKNLAFYKVPAKVVFRKELPKSLIGKVLRRMLALDEHPAPA
ncbi:MAG TPA: AMP-binding protein [Gemmatimonadaceae bacterium]|nr:AMP-binding protein [Gemmatimonadaceae bacterium]